MRDAKTSTPTTEKIADRRGFLKLAGASAVTTTAAVLGAPVAEAADAGGAKTSAGEYRETQHIRQYYDTAR